MTWEKTDLRLIILVYPCTTTTTLSLIPNFFFSQRAIFDLLNRLVPLRSVLFPALSFNFRVSVNIPPRRSANHFWKIRLFFFFFLVGNKTENVDAILFFFFISRRQKKDPLSSRRLIFLIHFSLIQDFNGVCSIIILPIWRIVWLYFFLNHSFYFLFFSLSSSFNRSTFFCSWNFIELPRNLTSFAPLFSSTTQNTQHAAI